MVLGEVVKHFAPTGSGSSFLQDGADESRRIMEDARIHRREAEAMAENMDLDIARPPYIHVSCQLVR